MPQSIIKKEVLVTFHFCNKLRHSYKQVMEKLTCGPTSFYICQLLITSLPFRDQLITDTYNRKFVHMLIIPFPVCTYATIYYRNGRWLIIIAAYAQTGNGIIKIWTNFLLYVSVIKWPPKGKDFLTLLRIVNNW